MTAPELRSFVRGVLDGLDPAARGEMVDALMARAAKGHSGWKPTRPPPRIVDDARSFADAARRQGYADPDDVSEHLRRGTKAFLAGDHASARAVFEALLPPISVVDIDLGQDELVEEVLGVDAHGCVAQYVTSVYSTTPLGERANAVYDAIKRVEGVSTLWNPIKDMEDVSAGTLLDLHAFLPGWMKRLGGRRPSKDEWESEHERWLREAVLRLEGVAGLERLSRKTKRPQTCFAWCTALVDRCDWAQALRAYDTPAMLRAKAKRALTRCPRTAGRQLGLLRVLVGDLRAAADLLSKAPGLGWSSEDHPGHVLFSLLATLLANGTPRKVSDTLLANLESASRDPLGTFSPDDDEGRPRLVTPSIVGLIQDIRPSVTLDEADRDALLRAMRLAAEKRMDGILGNSRRRHYGHAAMLAASCRALAPMGRETELSAWIEGLRQTYSRRHAFRQELTRAMASLGLTAID